MKKKLSVFSVFAMVSFLPLAAWASPEACKMNKIAELKISFDHNQPVVSALVNGQEARVALDTGAYKTAIAKEFVEKIGVKPTTIAGAYAYGLGGQQAALGVVTLDTLAIGDWQAKNVGMLVIAGHSISKHYDIILGRDIFNEGDIELDYAHNAIRLFQPDGCDDVPLAYWAQTYAEAPMKVDMGSKTANAVKVAVNGVETWALIDSGAQGSLLDRRVAGEAGVAEDSPGVVKGGDHVGVGARPVPSHIGTFATFSIGDETIRNVRLSFAQMGDNVEHGNYRMILGADFIKSHRIMIARDQRKLYFTNVSSPVFTPYESREAKADAGE